MSSLRIVLGNSTLAKYPLGGGHWTVRLQYLLGLRALGHDVHLLALLNSTGSPGSDQPLIDAFFSRWREYGLEDCVVLVVFPGEEAPQDLASARIIGRTLQQTEALIASADVLWNDCSAVLQPLLSKFSHRVMIDLDPGLLQTSLLHNQQAHSAVAHPWERDIFDHQVFLSVGRNMADDDCPVPRLGVTWQPFVPFVYLPMWPATTAPRPDAPFTGITHWNWGGQVPWQGRTLSFSKREAYLAYADLPRLSGRAFELAAYLGDDDGDRERLTSGGWRIVDPWQRLSTSADYRAYIAGSRAEILCPKPIYAELRTGWLSDRSVCYLAAGRPVLAGDTGSGRHVPTGQGFLTFSSITEALEGVAEIDAHYAEHSRSARALAEAYFDSAVCLKAMLAASGY